MRGPEQPQSALFSYLSVEDRIPQDHPLRALRKLVDPILTALSPALRGPVLRAGPPLDPARVPAARPAAQVGTDRDASARAQELRQTIAKGQYQLRAAPQR